MNVRTNVSARGKSEESKPLPRRSVVKRMRALDGVIMLSPDGQPAAGVFPENMWLVMGSDADTIEDFFGPSPDVLAAELEKNSNREDATYCVGFSAEDDQMVMNGDGTYPVYVSGLLKLHGVKHSRRGD